MSKYEEQRAKQIAKNKALFDELQLQNASKDLGNKPATFRIAAGVPSAKRRKTETVPTRPQRTSARIAASEVKPEYAEEKVTGEVVARVRKRIVSQAVTIPPADNPRRSLGDIDELKARWSSWEATETEPTRDENGSFHFNDYSDFLPNKSPAEVLREGCFGGTYFRPLYSKTLGITISNDWKELPPDWIAGLNIDRFLISPVYDAEINKFGVASGQTIEEWEANGWINHDHDVRGWFQWYCRFFTGRRCDDDERQISRWKKCVGETGRWRRMLLKKYVTAGIRSAVNEGDDEVEGVSPVIHQTCHHWAWEVRQHALEHFWNS